jgi:hypothetical protein
MFEALLNLIESFTNFNEKDWETGNPELLSIQKSSTKQEGTEKGEMTKVEVALMKLERACKFPTLRISCLIQNLFEKKPRHESDWIRDEDSSKVNERHEENVNKNNKNETHKLK